MDTVKKNGHSLTEMPNKKPQVLDPSGNPVSISDTMGGIFRWSNPQADIFISGPNEEFLYKIHQAFKVDACYARYGTAPLRTYKQFIIFYIADRSGMNQLDNWISMLRATKQEPQKPELFNVI